MQGTKIIGIFSKSKGHTGNSAEINLTRPKFNLYLCILVTHLYTEFQFKMSICNGDNERKLKINGIFLSPRGITLLKIIQPNPNSNSTCVLSWHTYVPNFNSKCQFIMEIMSGNWKLMEFNLGNEKCFTVVSHIHRLENVDVRWTDKKIDRQTEGQYRSIGRNCFAIRPKFNENITEVLSSFAIRLVKNPGVGNQPVATYVHLSQVHWLVYSHYKRVWTPENTVEKTKVSALYTPLSGLKLTKYKHALLMNDSRVVVTWGWRGASCESSR